MTGNTNKKSIANCFCLIKYQEKLDKKYHVLSAMRILNCSTKSYPFKYGHCRQNMVQHFLSINARVAHLKKILAGITNIKHIDFKV